MRLPVVERYESTIDEAEALRMIHCGIEHGVNYLIRLYHQGNSELLVGKALKMVTVKGVLQQNCRYGQNQYSDMERL